MIERRWPVPEYVAFLRGINVGGRTVKMDALREAFESQGYENVRTVLASGNVVFDAAEAEPAAVALKTQDGLRERLGIDTTVTVRTAEDIKKIAGAQPFEGVDLTSQTRLYVTLLGDRPGRDVTAPFESPEKDMRIIRVDPGEVFSTVELSEKRSTLDLMKVLEERFGRSITTRNWNTILKVAGKLGG
jgi:uncharacterized protein (DUF1697 family)